MSHDNEKQAAVEALLGISTAEAKENPHYQKLQRAWSDTETGNHRSSEQLRAAILAAVGDESRKPARKITAWWYIVAAAMVLFTINLFIWLPTKTHLNTTLYTANEATQVVPNLGPGIEARIATAKSFVATRHGKWLQISAQKLEAEFQFKPKTQGERLTIKTPTADFEVVGTKFTLNADEKSATLRVLEGRVRVKSGKVDQLVKAGEYWSGGTPISTQKQEKPDSVKVVRIRLRLRNGSAFEGVLESENALQLRLRVPALQDQIVTIQKSDIAESKRN